MGLQVPHCAAHRGVTIAALVLVFWGIRTGLTVVVIAIVLVAVLGIIELIGRPPVPADLATPPGQGGN